MTKTTNEFWTEEETLKLIEVYPHLSMKELLEVFPHKRKTQIKAKATYLKLKKDKDFKQERNSAWSNEELDILHEHYANSFIDDLCKMLSNKTKEQIRRRAIYDKLHKSEEILKQTIEKWNDEETEILKMYYEVCTMEELTEKIPDKTPRQILSKARSLELRKDEEFVNKYRSEKMLKNRTDLWTDEEIAVLYKYYKTGGAEECKKYLPKRSLKQIWTKAGKEGIQTLRSVEDWERVHEYQDPENLKKYTFVYKKKMRKLM